MLFNKILVVTDLTSSSDNALRMGIELANLHNSTLTILHVIPDSAGQSSSYSLSNKDLLLYRSILKRQIEGAQFHLEDQLLNYLGSRKLASPKCLVKAGVPAAVISKVADSSKADLIIIARGRGGVLSTIAEHVIRFVGRTVLVAPTKLPKSFDVSAVSFIPKQRKRATPRISA